MSSIHLKVRINLPQRAKSICRKVACGKAVLVTGFCQKHQVKSGWTDTKTSSSSERGYGWEWRKLRLKVLHRDKGLCKTCLVRGQITVATEVDHIIAKANGGTDDESNLQALCHSCHAKKTNQEKANTHKSTPMNQRPRARTPKPTPKSQKPTPQNQHPPNSIPRPHFFDWAPGRERKVGGFWYPPALY